MKKIRHVVLIWVHCKTGDSSPSTHTFYSMVHIPLQSICQNTFSPPSIQTPSKDKSISGERRADGFEGRWCLCLRWEASDGSEQLSSGILVWAIPWCHPNTHVSLRAPANIRHVSTKRQLAAGRKSSAKLDEEGSEYFIYILSQWIPD